MKIHIHQVNHSPIVEIISDQILINTAEEGLNLLGTIYFEGYDRLILHVKNITPKFFDLKTGIAGEILQKFSNYRVRLALVGDVSTYGSRPMQAFIHESNRWGHINFVSNLGEALQQLAPPPY